MTKITESESHYHHLEKMSVREILTNINKEDQIVPKAVEKCIPQIEKFIPIITEKIENGGRLFYIGAGTSGRLGVLDASECPPTFGIDFDKVIGIVAGGDSALKKAVEFAEDDTNQGGKDLLQFSVNENDFVIGLSASGSAPYVLGAIKNCKEKGIQTAGICNNLNSELAKNVDYAVECIVGPEFVSGSTRMKAGTAMKLILNMISTSVMIGLGRVKDNKMVDMKINNQKLRYRGVKMIMNELKINQSEALLMLEKYGSVRSVLNNFSN